MINERLEQKLRQGIAQTEAILTKEYYHEEIEEGMKTFKKTNLLAEIKHEEDLLSCYYDKESKNVVFCYGKDEIESWNHLGLTFPKFVFAVSKSLASDFALKLIGELGEIRDEN